MITVSALDFHCQQEQKKNAWNVYKFSHHRKQQECNNYIFQAFFVRKTASIIFYRLHLKLNSVYHLPMYISLLPNM